MAGPDQRMHEPQRPLAVDQPFGHQRADRLGAHIVVQAAEPARPRVAARRARPPRGPRRAGGGIRPSGSSTLARHRAGGPAAAAAAPRRRTPPGPRRPGRPAVPAAVVGSPRSVPRRPPRRPATGPCPASRRSVPHRRTRSVRRAAARSRSPPWPETVVSAFSCAVPDRGSRAVSTSSTARPSSRRARWAMNRCEG